MRTALISCLALVLAAIPTHAQLQAPPHLGGPQLAPTRCIAPEQQAILDGVYATLRELHGPTARTAAMTPPKLPFYPMAGTLYGDLFLSNFFDLDPGPGILDWDCTDWTYDGHNASDTGIRSFGEQNIGVPIFAALDGVVVFTHDGEPDMNTISSVGQCQNIMANDVVIDHGNGWASAYVHMKTGSVAVSPGDYVLAGQQIGLTGSSGCSSGPHLHFVFGDVTSPTPLEPFTGPCNPGESFWADQPVIRREFYVGDFNLSNVDLGSFPKGLQDDIPRQGTFVQGASRRVAMWTQLHNLPASSTYRYRFRRPDGTFALSSGVVSFNNPVAARGSRWGWQPNVNVDQTGRWRVVFEVNGQVVQRIPFDVVATAAELQNRPPNPITAHMEPAALTPNDAVTCRVDADLVTDDPDYDIVRFRYVWKIGNRVVRDVTSAAHSDMVPRQNLRPGQALTCTVTPSDGTDEGAPVTAVARYDDVRPWTPRGK